MLEWALRSFRNGYAVRPEFAQQLVTDMAGIFQVSKQAMRIRLENHNLL